MYSIWECCLFHLSLRLVTGGGWSKVWAGALKQHRECFFLFAACCQILIIYHHFRIRGNYQVNLSGILRLYPLLSCREYRVPCIHKKVKASQACAPNFTPGVITVSYDKLYAGIFRNWDMKDIYHLLLKRGKHRASKIRQRLAEVPLLHWEMWLGCRWSYIARWPDVFRLFSTYCHAVHGVFGHSQPHEAQELHLLLTNCTVCESQIGHSVRKSSVSRSLSVVFQTML